QVLDGSDLAFVVTVVLASERLYLHVERLCLLLSALPHFDEEGIRLGLGDESNQDAATGSRGRRDGRCGSRRRGDGWLRCRGRGGGWLCRGCGGWLGRRCGGWLSRRRGWCGGWGAAGGQDEADGAQHSRGARTVARCCDDEPVQHTEGPFASPRGTPGDHYRTRANACASACAKLGQITPAGSRIRLG